MNVQQFFSKYNGKFIDYDGMYSTQCTDLMRAYIKEVLGWSPYVAIPQTGWAKNIFNNFSNNKYFTKILNTPTGMPKKGDLVFWGYYPFVTGWVGHVAVYDSGDVMKLITFDQNYKTGTPCHYQKHSYRGVLGWLSPR